MREYLTIGPSPSGEPCAQVGADDYGPRSRAECKLFIDQLRRQFGTEPGTACLKVKAFEHDFGTYREVICMYDDTDAIGQAYAYKLEAETPKYWDDTARRHLIGRGLSVRPPSVID